MATAAAHVLVVDDAPELRALFRDALEAEGYRVSLAAEALDVEAIARLRPDAILLDLLLGEDEEAAWRLAQRVRHDPRLSAVPILVCSAASRLLQRLEPELRALGAVFVPKPFELDDLYAAVEQAVRATDRP
jgi:CheY-like chemotaxis protein